jgi:NTP pyrophosphatase (non-canonical NTP hydrolase)
VSVLQLMVSTFRYEVERLGFCEPTPRDSMAFIITEAAELLDAMLKGGYGDMEYVRARPQEKDVEGEMGDLLLMVLTLANQLDIDTTRALNRSMDKIRARLAAGKAEMEPPSF